MNKIQEKVIENAKNRVRKYVENKELKKDEYISGMDWSFKEIKEKTGLEGHKFCNVCVRVELSKGQSYSRTLDFIYSEMKNDRRHWFIV